MPYTPPAGNAVTFNFTGAAYTPLLGNAVVLNFKPPGPILTADPGTYSLTGTAANLLYGRNTKGTNLIINGDFPVDTSPWIVVGADTTFTAVSGEGVLTLGPGASGGYAYQTVSVVPGARYKLVAFLDPTTTSHAGIQVGTTIDGAQLGSVELAYPHSAKRTIRFTAPSSGTVYVSIYTSAALSCSAGFDQIALTGPVPASPTVDYGIYVITGSDAILTKNSRTLAAAGGTYAITGSPASLVVQRRLVADGGVYIQTRATAQLRVGRVVAAAPGSYSLSGTDASLTYIIGRFITPAKGVYAIAGSDARLLVSRRILLTTELVSNGAFADGSGWSTVGNVIFSGGAANISSITSNIEIWQAVGLPPAGTQFDVTFTISNYVRGTIGFIAFGGGGSIDGSGRSANGTYTERLTVPAGGPSTVANSGLISFGGGFVGSIDNFSIRTGGTYALIGADAGWVYRRAIKADPATYTLTGGATGLKLGYRLPAASGSYVLSGTDLALVNRRLTADSGAYAVVGADARLLVGKRLVAVPGVYTVTGAATALLLHRRLPAASGSYALTSTNVTLRVGRRLAAASGAYVINGAVARVARDYVIQAAPGVYALTGTAMRPLLTRRMLLASRDFKLTWLDVALVPKWRPRGPRAIAVGFAASRYLSVGSQSRRVVVGRQDRRIPVEPAARRYAAVEPRDKEPMGGSMLQWPEKDPNEVLDYELDWADPNDPRLVVGETLLTSVWSVVLGDVVINVGLTNFTPQGLSTVWLSGGTPATKCELLNRVTTSMGRTYDKSVVLRVRDH